MTSESLDLEKLRAPLFATHDNGVNWTYEWRVDQLKTLHQMIRERRSLFVDALSQDLGRHPTESIIAEIIPLEIEIQDTLKNLNQWMKPEKVSMPLMLAPLLASVESRPLQPPGVLIIGPFNYPLQLTLRPLVGALAAGNPCVIKPR
jgi:aldehyde dehydrogenase (NAD+)